MAQQIYVDERAERSEYRSGLAQIMNDIIDIGQLLSREELESLVRTSRGYIGDKLKYLKAQGVDVSILKERYNSMCRDIN